LMLCLDTYPQKLELLRVTRTRPDVGRQSAVDIHSDASSTTPDPVSPEQRVSVDGEVVVSVPLLQVRLGDDGNVHLVAGQVHR